MNESNMGLIVRYRSFLPFFRLLYNSAVLGMALFSVYFEPVLAKNSKDIPADAMGENCEPESFLLKAIRAFKDDDEIINITVDLQPINNDLISDYVVYITQAAYCGTKGNCSILFAIGNENNSFDIIDSNLSIFMPAGPQFMRSAPFPSSRMNDFITIEDSGKFDRWKWSADRKEYIIIKGD